MSMNPFTKRKWVKALRSGEYVQGTGQLVRTSNNYKPTHHCCLGVLVDECAPEFLAEEYDLIPDDLATTWGLSEHEQEELAEMNDDRVPFHKIADHIESEL